MPKIKNNQNGFLHIEIIAVLASVVIIVTVGFFVVSHSGKKPTKPLALINTSKSTTSPKTTTSPSLSNTPSSTTTTPATPSSGSTPTKSSRSTTVPTTSTKTTTTTPATPTQPVANSTVAVFKIPELAIQITVPSSIEDIVYKVNPSGTLSTGQQTQSVTLSTQTLTSLDSDCSVSGSAPPLGTISKTQGQYPTNPDIDLNNASGGLVKQFPTYYIAWGNPEGACGTSTSTQNEANKDTNLFSTALWTTVQPLQ